MPASTAVVIRHVAFEDLGSLGPLLAARGFELRWLDAGVDDLGAVEPTQAALLVVLGGPIGVYETGRYPWLAAQIDWLRRRRVAGRPTLGICLGAQMIAWHLGAEVGPPKDEVHEFGYYELFPTPEAEGLIPTALHVVQSHWHGFGMPEGAVRLASSALYPNQAFRLGQKAYGFQFHAEVTGEGFGDMQARSARRYGLPGVQTVDEQNRLRALHDESQAAWFEGFLAKLFPGPDLP